MEPRTPAPLSGAGCSCVVLFVAMAGAALSGLFATIPAGDALPILAVVVGVFGAMFSFARTISKETKKEFKPPELPPRIRVFRQIKVTAKGQVRCPYCHDHLEGEQRACRSCPGCRAIYHDDCLMESEGCTTLGCVHLGPRRPAFRA